MTDTPLAEFITPKKGNTPRPKRFMVGVKPEDYEWINDLAKELNTTKINVVTALINFYDNKTAN